MENRLNVAIVQEAPVFLNLEASLELACQQIEKAAAAGASLVVFPETWLPGYPIWLDLAPGSALWDHAPAKALFRVLFENSMTLPGSHFLRLRQTVVDSGIFLVMGLNERQGGTLYNSMLFLGPDGSHQLHRKLVPTYNERMIWGRGDGSMLTTLGTPVGPVGGLICWEHWMPLARAAMHALGEVVHVAQWPMVKDLHQIASRHYAFEGQCFVLAAGCVLSREQVLNGYKSLPHAPAAGLELLDSMPDDQNGLLLRGGSAIIGPDARYLVGPVYDQPALLHAELCLAEITEASLALDTDGHYSRPDVFQLKVNTQPQQGVVFQ